MPRSAVRCCIMPCAVLWMLSVLHVPCHWCISTIVQLNLLATQVEGGGPVRFWRVLGKERLLQCFAVVATVEQVAIVPKVDLERLKLLRGCWEPSSSCRQQQWPVGQGNTADGEQHPGQNSLVELHTSVLDGLWNARNHGRTFASTDWTKWKAADEEAE